MPDDLGTGFVGGGGRLPPWDYDAYMRQLYAGQQGAGVPPQQTEAIPPNIPRLTVTPRRPDDVPQQPLQAPPPEDPFERAAMRTRAPYAAAAQPSDKGLGQLAQSLANAVGGVGGLVGATAAHLAKIPERLMIAANTPREMPPGLEMTPQEYDRTRSEMVGSASGDLIRAAIPVRNPLGAIPPGFGATTLTSGGRVPREPVAPTRAPGAGAETQIPVRPEKPATTGDIARQSYLSPEDQKLFASRYPEAGAYEMKPNKAKGTEYRSKVWTPEEERLAAARSQVMEDMKQGGWKPYFDPQKRSDVDLAEYMRLFGKPEDTRALRMKGPEAAQRHLDIATSPEAIARLTAAYKTGAKLGEGPKGFYKMAQLEKEHIDALGPDEGRRNFVKMFTQPMAATTGGSNPSSNLLQSGYGNFMRESGQPLPTGASYEIPYPIGGSKYGAAQNLKQYEQMLYPGASGIAHSEHPKRFDFDWAFRGKRDRPVIDEQMMGQIQPGGPGSPPTPGYGLYTEAVHGPAKKAKVDPIQFQEVGWAGFKNMKEVEALMKGGRSEKEAKAMAFQGKPMISDVNEAIERTSRLLNVSPATVVRKALVEGKMPLYGVGGTLLLGASTGGSGLGDILTQQQGARQ